MNVLVWAGTGERENNTRKEKWPAPPAPPGAQRARRRAVRAGHGENEKTGTT